MGGDQNRLIRERVHRAQRVRIGGAEWFGQERQAARHLERVELLDNLPVGGAVQKAREEISSVIWLT